VTSTSATSTKPALFVLCISSDACRPPLEHTEGTFALSDLSAAASVEIPRLSSSRVIDCQVEVSPVDGRLGVVWREALQQAVVAVVPPLE